MGSIYQKIAIFQEFLDISARYGKRKWHALGESNPSFQVENLAS